MYDLADVDVLGGTYYMADATPSLETALQMVGGRRAVIVKEFGVVGQASFASVGLVRAGVLVGRPGAGAGRAAFGGPAVELARARGGRGVLLAL